jgi:hypothetical protein
MLAVVMRELSILGTFGMDEDCQGAMRLRAGGFIPAKCLDSLCLRAAAKPGVRTRQ